MCSQEQLGQPLLNFFRGPWHLGKRVKELTPSHSKADSGQRFIVEPRGGKSQAFSLFGSGTWAAGFV